MEIKIDGEAAASLASKAIFDSLDQATRDDVVKQALQYLMTPKKSDTWSSTPGKTPLQEAFDQAIWQVATKVVRDRVENDPEVTARVNELLGPLITKAIDGEAESGYKDALANEVGQALGNWLAAEARDRR